MNYVLTDNEIVIEGPMELPSTWNNISGFNFLGEEQLISYGWYPCSFSPYQGPMDDIVITGSYFVKEGNEYVQYQTVRNKTQSEIDSETESMWQSVRVTRNQLLTACDWTQLPDVPLPTEKVEQWRKYRQDLRNITDSQSPYAISWPDPPQD